MIQIFCLYRRFNAMSGSGVEIFILLPRAIERDEKKSKKSKAAFGVVESVSFLQRSLSGGYRICGVLSNLK